MLYSPLFIDVDCCVIVAAHPKYSVTDVALKQFTVFWGIFLYFVKFDLWEHRCFFAFSPVVTINLTLHNAGVN